MATKLELQQHLTRLTNDNLALREKLSVLTTDNKFLREKLAESDIRAKRLIAAGNRRGCATSERRAAMEAARKQAMATGTVVKAEVSRV